MMMMTMMVLSFNIIVIIQKTQLTSMRNLNWFAMRVKCIFFNSTMAIIVIFNYMFSIDAYQKWVQGIVFHNDDTSRDYEDYDN